MIKKMNVLLIIMIVILCFSCLFVFLVPYNRNKQNNANNIDENEVVNFSDLTMACIGDSITRGLCMGQQMENPYPSVVKETLNLQNVYNLGIGGKCISYYDEYAFVKRFTNIPNDTDIVCVFGGVNDWAKGVQLGTIDSTDIKTIYGALNFIARVYSEEYSNTFVFFATPLPVSDAKLEAYSSTPYSLQDVGLAMKEVGKKYNIPVCDTWNCGFGEICNDATLTDGVHPNQDFHTNNLAPLFSQFIKDNYKK